MAELSNADRELAPQETGEAGSTTRTAVRVWQMLFVAILIAFMALLALRLWQTKQSEQRAAGEAPPFTFTTFDGETISLADLAGKGVVLNFWASWCDPCRVEADLLEQTWRQEKNKDVVFIGLDYLDQEPAAKAYLAEFDVTYPNGPDLRSEAARHYGIKGVPETFFIDPQGRIVDTIIGPIATQGQLDQLLARIRPQ